MTAKPAEHDPLDRHNELESAHGALRHAAHVAAMQGSETTLVPVRELMVLLAGAPIRAKQHGRAFLPGEPLFIIRAKDDSAIAAINVLRHEGIYPVEAEVLAKFAAWRDRNASACKEPD